MDLDVTRRGQPEVETPRRPEEYLGSFADHPWKFRDAAIEKTPAPCFSMYVYTLQVFPVPWAAEEDYLHQFSWSLFLRSMMNQIFDFFK